MKNNIACFTCDLLMELPELDVGQRARCPRCGTAVAELKSNSFQNGIALSVAALIFLCGTFFYPMLGFSIQGQQRSMTLLDSGVALIGNSENILGGLVILFIIALPAVLLLILLILLFSLIANFKHPVLVWFGRGFYFLREWHMVEVYIIGLLVSLTKIASMAKIELGLSFWSLLAFGLCFIAAIYSVDKHHVWHTIKELYRP